MGTGSAYSIANGLLMLRTLTPYDASAILFHGVAGQDWDVIAHLSIGTFGADADTWSALAEPAGWFVLVGTGEVVSSPDSHHPVSDTLVSVSPCGRWRESKSCFGDNCTI